MATTIWKFQLERLARQRISMAEGAKVLHVDIQNNKITMWAAIDPLAPIEMRCFSVVGTGHPIPEQGIYVGTVLDDPFVWHIFESDF